MAVQRNTDKAQNFCFHKNDLQIESNTFVRLAQSNDLRTCKNDVLHIHISSDLRPFTWISILRFRKCSFAIRGIDACGRVIALLTPHQIDFIPRQTRFVPSERRVVTSAFIYLHFP